MNGFLLPGATPDALLGLLADVTIRGSILLALVAGLARLLRGRSAAVRHVLWTVGIVGFLALPMLSANVPWKLRVLPAIQASAAGATAAGAPPAGVLPAQPAEFATEVPGSEAAPAAPVEAMGAPAARSGGVTGAAPAGGGSAARGPDDSGSSPRATIPPFSPGGGIDLRGFLLWAWGLGAGLLILRLIVGNVRVRALLARSRELTDEASEREVFHLARRLDIGSYVRLLVSDEISMPITTGIRRPAIVLPAGFEDWTEDRLRAVILHELAHIHRRDVLSHLASRVACALHWFNPLAWHSAARLRTESERACDDLVLRAGTRASAYADHLLSILRSCSTVPSPAMAIPMARRTEFEGRLLAILEPDARRAAAGRATVLALAAAVAVIALPLAAVAPAEGPDGTQGLLSGDLESGTEGAPADRAADLSALDGTADAGAEAERTADQPDARTDHDRDGLAATLEGLARGASDAVAGVITDILAQQPLDQESTESRLINALAPVLAGDDDVSTRRAAALALGEVEDPRAVEALSRALENDPDESVRRAAAWALGEIESPRGIPALARAAQTDASQEVREMAVWALGEIEHPDAIPALARVAASGETAGIRRRAVWGLGEIEHPDAVPALARIATSNEPLELRRMAVWGLGVIEHPSAIPALGALIRNGNGPLKRMAIWALGEIEHPDGVEFLRAPLSDGDPDVRRGALWALGAIESEAGVDAIAGALSDSDPRIRAMAVWALGEIESARAVPHLAPLLRDRDPDVRKRVAWALGQIESGSATDALAAIAGDGDVGVRRTVIWALSQIEDPRAVPALRRALTDAERDIRFLALQGLADIETAASVEAILDALESGDPEMRRAATAALGRGGVDMSDFRFDFQFDFDFDFDAMFEGFDWGWDPGWDEWSDDPGPDPDP